MAGIGDAVRDVLVLAELARPRPVLQLPGCMRRPPVVEEDRYFFKADLLITTGADFVPKCLERLDEGVACLFARLGRPVAVASRPPPVLRVASGPRDAVVVGRAVARDKVPVRLKMREVAMVQAAERTSKGHRPLPHVSVRATPLQPDRRNPRHVTSGTTRDRRRPSDLA